MTTDQKPAQDWEPGWYWIRHTPGASWQARQFDKEWLECPFGHQPHEVGPRIRPPSDPSADFAAGWDAAVEALRQWGRDRFGNGYAAKFAADHLSAHRPAARQPKGD